LVLRLEDVHAAAPVELTAEHFVRLHETLKLLRKISILALKALGVLLKGISLGEKVTVVGAVLRASDAKALNVAAASEKSVLFLLKSALRVPNLNTHVSVSALLEVNLLPKIVVFTGNSLVVPSKGGVLSCKLGVLFADAAKLPLSVLQRQLFVPKVSVAAVKQLLGVFDAGLGSRQLKVQALQLVTLLGGFVAARLIHLLEASELAPHLGTLDLDALDLTLKIRELSASVIVLVGLGDGLLA
jgi:hypothetical protein